MVGLLPSNAEIDAGRTWVAALINDKALTTFVSKIELAGIVELLYAAGVKPHTPTPTTEAEPSPSLPPPAVDQA